MGMGEEFLTGPQSIRGWKGPMEVIESSLMLTSNRAFANPQTAEIPDSRCSRRGQSDMGRTHELQRSLVCKDTSTPVKKDSRTTKNPCKVLYMRENEINTLNSAHFCKLQLKLQGYI